MLKLPTPLQATAAHAPATAAPGASFGSAVLPRWPCCPGFAGCTQSLGALKCISCETGRPGILSSGYACMSNCKGNRFTPAGFTRPQSYLPRDVKSANLMRFERCQAFVLLILRLNLAFFLCASFGVQSSPAQGCQIRHFDVVDPIRLLHAVPSWIL
eukprot:990395-Pelagomonas_calceolata.AAC.1